MKIFSSKKRVAAIGAVTAATLLGGGMAVAYWTADGTGSGSASTAEGLANLAISQTTVLSDMYPGDSPQALTVNVQNDGANSAYVASLGAYITTDAAGCDGTDFRINGASSGDAGTPTPLSWTAQELAVGADVDSTGNTVQFNNKPNDNQDVCKDAVVTLNYVAG